ncbi:uncharacterized protein L201_006163 [Kwoniella dendrophila CBS 6074]|uniref:Uncharacterized protein n=1 Tax=Kwoniella dendrophila CBS 6074 TaxID=1295534 RepID=A0AAX4K0X8_9TREE
MSNDRSGAGVRVLWNADLTLKLLKLIKKEKTYRRIYFPRSTTVPKDRHLTARCAVMDFFGQDEWMKDAERRGLATWDDKQEDWIPTPKWGSGISNPINGRINGLKKKMADGYYRKNHGIEETWTSFEDIPDKKKRAQFRESHSYYFILRELYFRDEKEGRPEALLLQDLPRADPKPGQRRKRSPSPASSTSSSSSSGSSSESEPEIKPVLPSPSSGSSVQAVNPPRKRVKVEETGLAATSKLKQEPLTVMSDTAIESQSQNPRSPEDTMALDAAISINRRESTLSTIRFIQ